MGVFERILKQSPLDGEELRYDLAVSLPMGVDYVGLAADGSSTAQAVWSIVKVEYNGDGLLQRQRLHSNVAWDNRYQIE